MVLRVLGQPAPKVEGVSKVTGSAKYTADYALPGILAGKVLRSPHPYARILSIDTSQAEALPGVHAVVTAADTNGGLWGGAGIKDQPVFASDIVRFSGEAVAAVAADDEDIAEQALNLIDVEYEELDPLLTVAEAEAPGAPVLHPNFNNYSGVFHEKLIGPDMYSQYNRAGLPALETVGNQYHKWEIVRGDIEKGFAEADAIVENTYYAQRMHQAYLEPRAAVVEIKDDGRVEVWGSIKSRYGTRDSLALVAGLERDDVIVNYTNIGGDFGGKGTPIVVPMCYFLAKKSGRPVRLVLDYLEELLAGNGRHAVKIRMKTGVKRDGTISAHQAWYEADSGAYACYKPWGIIWGPTQAAGVYRLGSLHVEQTHTYTNTFPAGFMRMPGEVQAFFALESQIDAAARAIGWDPVEFRMKNLIEAGEPMPYGTLYEDVRVKETLAAAAELAKYTSPKRPNVGRGAAICHKATGGGEAHASITLREDGTVKAGTGMQDQGTGTFSVMRQVIAEELQIPLDRIQVEAWSTEAGTNDSGIGASRGTRLGSTAAYAAAIQTRKQLFELAAEHFGCEPEQVSLKGDDLWRADIEESISWPKLLSLHGGELTGVGVYNDPDRSHYTSFSAQFAEVEVNPETGEVDVLTLTNAFDVGTVFDPIAHQGQINGNMIQGLGYAVTEEIILQDGRTSTLSFGDYKIPAISDIPELRSTLVEGGEGLGPYKIKGVGEQLLGAVAPAIANAIADAVGVRICELPLTSEKVFRALQDKTDRSVE